MISKRVLQCLKELPFYIKFLCGISVIEAIHLESHFTKENWSFARKVMTCLVNVQNYC